jgi:glucokinase
MESTRSGYDRVILAGDVGGTNTNLALIGKKGGRYSVIVDRHYRTKEETSLMEPTRRFLSEALSEYPGIAPEICCISGAGALAGRTIDLTNAPWSVDGDALEASIGVPVLVINDFTAISFGILLLDPGNPGQITCLPHSDGSIAIPGKGVKVILGAGTGLGVAYVVHADNRDIVMASEGGHVTLPVYDETTRRFQSWLESRYGFTPGAEAGISGQGIANLFEFFATSECRRGPETGRILDASSEERPALVASLSDRDPACAAAMETFVRLYARRASDLAATFLPAGGIYLAGGIAAKNEAWFLGGNRFMSMFEKSYAPHIRKILAGTPVMIVKDYSISLYGAANAAISLS